MNYNFGHFVSQGLLVDVLLPKTKGKCMAGEIRLIYTMQSARGKNLQKN